MWGRCCELVQCIVILSLWFDDLSPSSRAPWTRSMTDYTEHAIATDQEIISNDLTRQTALWQLQDWYA